MRRQSDLQVLMAEADRYSLIAEQSANRIHVTLSVGVAALSGVVAGSFVGESVVLLAIAPFVSTLVLVIAAFGSLESLYASAYHASAEAQIRLLRRGNPAIPLYGRGPRQRPEMVRFGDAMWSAIVIGFVALTIADYIVAFSLTSSRSWVRLQDVGATQAGILACAILVVLVVVGTSIRFNRAWREFKAFQERYVPSNGEDGSPES